MGAGVALGFASACKVNAVLFLPVIPAAAVLRILMRDFPRLGLHWRGHRTIEGNWLLDISAVLFAIIARVRGVPDRAAVRVHGPALLGHVAQPAMEGRPPARVRLPGWRGRLPAVRAVRGPDAVPDAAGEPRRLGLRPGVRYRRHRERSSSAASSSSVAASSRGRCRSSRPARYSPSRATASSPSCATSSRSTPSWRWPPAGARSRSGHGPESRGAAHCGRASARLARTSGAGAGMAGVFVLFIATVWWALAFQAVYSNPNPRIAASQWIDANIPKGSTLTNEIWDDSLPYILPGADYNDYVGIATTPYDTDSAEKVRELVYGHPEDNGNGGLINADYVILSSTRVRASVARLPAEYPATNRYYQLLDSGAARLPARGASFSRTPPSSAFPSMTRTPRSRSPSTTTPSCASTRRRRRSMRRRHSRCSMTPTPSAPSTCCPSKAARTASSSPPRRPRCSRPAARSRTSSPATIG